MILDENSKYQRGFPDNECEPAGYYRKGILRPRLMSAADYVFYLRRHLVAERRKNDPNVGFPGDENLSVGIPRLSFLLRRLEEDIQSSYLSFLEEFVSEVHDGVGCLLNLLRTCLGRQKGTTSMFPYATCSRGRQSLVNKGTIDEFYCLLCLKAASRSSMAVGKMSCHKTGLSTVASCIMSAHMKSRVIAIELLTATSKCPENGAVRVQEAMTAVRIIFGESVRFKFLVSMLTSNIGTSHGLETVIMAFLNTLLDQTPKIADRIRIQSELEEAGLDVQALEKELRQKMGNSNHRLWTEIDKWRELQVDLQNVVQKHHENIKLRKEVQLLRTALKRLQEERSGILTIHKELRGQWLGMEQRIKALALKTRALQHSSTDDEHDSGGDSTPTSESSAFDCSYNIGKPSSSQKPVATRMSPESHDSELEEILIDIPTIIPGSIFDIQPDNSKSATLTTTKRQFSTSGRKASADIPPPLPPNHPKLSDSGISSAPDSDPDLNLEWHYPEIPSIKVEKRSSSVRVRFSETSQPMSTLSKEVIPTGALVLPPGKNKTKCADIVGIENPPVVSKKDNTMRRRFFSGGFGTVKTSKDKSNKAARTSSTHRLFRSSGKKGHGNKLWSKDQKQKEDSKKASQMGSSLNGMIHREIAKAIRERNALFEP